MRKYFFLILLVLIFVAFAKDANQEIAVAQEEKKAGGIKAVFWFLLFLLGQSVTILVLEKKTNSIYSILEVANVIFARIIMSFLYNPNSGVLIQAVVAKICSSLIMFVYQLKGIQNSTPNKNTSILILKLGFQNSPFHSSLTFDESTKMWHYVNVRIDQQSNDQISGLECIESSRRDSIVDIVCGFSIIEPSLL